MAMLFRLLRATVLDSAQVVQYVTNAGSLILNLLAIPKSMHKKNIYIYQNIHVHAKTPIFLGSKTCAKRNASCTCMRGIITRLIAESCNKLPSFQTSAACTIESRTLPHSGQPNEGIPPNIQDFHAKSCKLPAPAPWHTTQQALPAGKGIFGQKGHTGIIGLKQQPMWAVFEVSEVSRNVS